MDFTGRGSQPAQPANAGPQFSGAPAQGPKKSSKNNKSSKLALWGGGVLGLLVVALVVAVIVVIGIGGTKPEDKFVDSGKMQAVFLQTGQVYFGDLSSVNSKYFVLNNIYYLQTSSNGAATDQTAANTSVSLVKLGCELHAPYDQMVINRDQVTFWENLQSDGQVAKAVSTFKKDNPNGQKCTDQSAANGAGSVQSSGTSNGGAGTTTNTGTGTATGTGTSTPTTR